MKITLYMAGSLFLAFVLGAFGTTAWGMARKTSPAQKGTVQSVLAPSPEIRQLVAQTDPLSLYGVDQPALRRFYELRNFAPAWSASPAAAKNAAFAIATLQHAVDDGLDPAAYHLDAILARQQSLSPAQLAQFDVLLSDAAMRFMHDLRLGRIRPEAVNRDVELPELAFDASGALADVLAHGGIASAIGELAPPHDEYGWLRKALLRYRALARNGGWPKIPGGNRLDPQDAQESRLDVLAKRLAAEDATVPIPASADDLQAALKRYQLRNGLDTDGVAGAATLAALNISAEQRVDQIAANMERWRWLPYAFPPTYIEVNTADASLKVVDRGKIVLSSRIVSGKSSTPTPIFAATVTGVTFNPYWNIPANIARTEIVPKAAKNPGYLGAEGIFFDGESDSWKQLPGDKNALGRLKLEMPNRFNAYLHDTPAKRLFSKVDRHFSHGCMRVEQIRALASFAMTGDVNAGLQKIEAAIASGENKQVKLDRPLPVYVLYWTAMADRDGAVEFRPDIYGRDQRLMAALAAQRPIGRVSLGADCQDNAG